jgi:nucleotide-binding universal stress UspA family protein
MFKHILVPTDGSHLSQEAVSWTVTFAREAGARITFVCAVPLFPKMYVGPGAIFADNAARIFHENAESTAREILDAAEALAREAGVACTALVLTCDRPYEVIVNAASQNGCDLICMASHGRRGASAILLGSETQKVLTHSYIPVLVHRPQVSPLA